MCEHNYGPSEVQLNPSLPETDRLAQLHRVVSNVRWLPEPFPSLSQGQEWVKIFPPTPARSLTPVSRKGTWLLHGAVQLNTTASTLLNPAPDCISTAAFRARLPSLWASSGWGKNISEAEQKCTYRALGGYLTAFLEYSSPMFFSILLVAGPFPRKRLAGCHRKSG